MEWFSKLIDACMNGSLSEVVECIVHVFNIDQADSDGWSPLHWAAKRGHKAIVELLLEHRASVNKKSKDEETPLFMAAQYGHADVVMQLLEHRADVGMPKKNGATPLYIAAQNGHADVVKQLLEHSASVDAVIKTSYHNMLPADVYDGAVNYDTIGATPLHVASKKGHTRVVELLLVHHASVDATDVNGATALFVASKNGHKDIVQLLLRQGARTDTKVWGNQTPLTVTATEDIRAVVELYHKSQQSHERGLARLSDRASTPSETELTKLVSPITSVYDLRLRLSLVSVDPDKRLVEQIIAQGNQLVEHVGQLQRRLAHSEENIKTVASSLQQFLTAYVSRLEQEKKKKKTKMACGLVAATFGFVFTPVLNKVVDSIIDLANPVEVFSLAFEETAIAKFLAESTSEHVLKPLVTSTLEELMIPKDTLESVLRETLALKHPEFVEQTNARGLVVDVVSGTSDTSTSTPVQQPVIHAGTTQSMQSAATAAAVTPTNTLETAPERGSASAASKSNITFVDDIEMFPYHRAVRASLGDHHTFCHLIKDISTDDGNSDSIDPTATMAIRVTETMTTTLCAAEYAYCRGYREIGDYLASRMHRDPSSFDVRPAISVEFLEAADPDAFVFICVVDESDGDVDLCQSLCDSVPDEEQSLEARIRAVVERGSKDVSSRYSINGGNGAGEVPDDVPGDDGSVRWSCVEYASHLGYVSIVTHLLNQHFRSMPHLARLKLTKHAYGRQRE